MAWVAAIVALGVTLPNLNCVCDTLAICVCDALANYVCDTLANCV